MVIFEVKFQSPFFQVSFLDGCNHPESCRIRSVMKISLIRFENPDVSLDLLSVHGIQRCHHVSASNRVKGHVERVDIQS